MGSEYIVYQRSEQKGDIEVSLGEMSCKFSLDITTPHQIVHDLSDGGPTVLLRDLDADDLFNIGLKFLQTSSYYQDEQDSTEFLNKVKSELRMLI